MTDFEYREEAIPLVTINSQTNKFVLNPEAVSLIKSIEAPISIVGVAGMYRTGKSYLLNRVILDRSNGFGVAPTINACTKGLWLWAKPLKGQTEDGKIVNILVVDSEGLGAVDQDSNHDCRVFALVLLFSSIFLYNSLGTIDENAISNLGLVINLTKHIHIKSGAEDEISSEEYAKYFPDFMWILRDFSLQLIDQEGESITASEYLENSLAAQKGFSDEIETKNRIRRLVQMFFPQRDCFTLVRPMMEEEDLQSLEDRSLETLRPEFIEQVLTLRKCIFKNAKLKTLNGKALNGEMLSGVMKNYIEAINNGAVPNIESAWTYICKDHCYKMFHECLNYYNQRFNERLLDQFPTSEEYLDIIHEELQKEALEKFKKESMGENSQNYIENLELKIREKFSMLKNENKREFQAMLESSLNQYYAKKIDDKLKRGEFKNYYDYEKELTKMKTNFMDSEPQGPGKRAMVNEFLLTRSSDAAHFLIKSSQSDLESKINVLMEAKERLEKELYNTEEQLNKEKNDLSMKIFSLESRKNDLETKKKLFEEKIQDMRKDREAMEEELCGKLDKEKEDARKREKISRDKYNLIEEQKRELEKKIVLMKSDHEKELALLDQKLGFFETEGSQWERREKEMKSELEDLNRKLSNDILDLKKNYETQISKLQSELYIAREGIKDYQSEIEKKEELHVSMCKDIEDKNKTFQNILEEKELAIKNYQDKMETLIKTPEELEELRKRNQTLIEKLQVDVQNLTVEGKKKDDKMKLLELNFKKEKALMEQSINFYEIQVDDLQKQLDDVNRLNSDALNAIQGLPGKKTDFSKELEEERKNFQVRLDQLNNDFKKNKELLNAKIVQLTEKNEDLESERKEINKKYEKELKEMKELYSVTKDEMNSNRNHLQNLESQREKELEEANNHYMSKIEDLEKEIDILKDKNAYELSIIQSKSDESLQQLRNLYEEEKKQLKAKMDEEKHKFNKISQNYKNDYEMRLKKEREMYEDQVDNLQQDMKELEIQIMATGQSHQQEITSKNQKIEHLEQSLKETKNTLDKIQETSTLSLKQATSNYENERKSFVTKIEQLNQELSHKDIALFQLKQDLEHIQNSKDRKMKELKKQADSRAKEIKLLQASIQELKQQYQEKGDDWMEKENKMSKDLALSNQKNEFYLKRMNELNNQINTLNKQFEERLLAKKEEIQMESKESISRIKSERDLMEQRYEAKKRQIKELEKEYQVKVNEGEKNMLLLQEKLANLESKNYELERKYNSEIATVEDQMKATKEAQAIEIKTLKSQLEQLRVKTYEQELELVECQANYDKDLALWQGKNQFLEQQKKQLRNELSETQKNFEILVNKFQQFRISEKEEAETNQSAMLSKMEQRMVNQLEDVKDQHRMVVQDYEDKLRKLERENQRVQEKMLDIEKTKRGSSALVEKRLEEALSNERRYQEDILNLKKERDDRIISLQRKVDEEREKSRMRLFQAEQMLKESENKRQNLIFEYEKQKTKWNIENSQLISQHNEYLEQIDRLSKDKDSLIRENEKLHSDVRQAKRNTNSSSLVNNFANFSKRDFLFGDSRTFSRFGGDYTEGKRGSNDGMRMSSDFFYGVEALNSNEKKY